MEKPSLPLWFCPHKTGEEIDRELVYLAKERQEIEQRIVYLQRQVGKAAERLCITNQRALRSNRYQTRIFETMRKSLSTIISNRKKEPQESQNT